MDGVQLLIATVIVASVVAYMFIHETAHPAGFPFAISGPDNLGIDPSLLVTFYSLLFWFCGYLVGMALWYSFAFFKPTSVGNVRRLTRLDEVIGRSADIIFLIGVIDLLLFCVVAVVRILEAL